MNPNLIPPRLRPADGYTPPRLRFDTQGQTLRPNLDLFDSTSADYGNVFRTHPSGFGHFTAGIVFRLTADHSGALVGSAPTFNDNVWNHAIYYADATEARSVSGGKGSHLLFLLGFKTGATTFDVLNFELPFAPVLNRWYTLLAQWTFGASPSFALTIDDVAQSTITLENPFAANATAFTVPNGTSLRQRNCICAVAGWNNIVNRVSGIDIEYNQGDDRRNGCSSEVSFLGYDVGDPANLNGYRDWGFAMDPSGLERPIDRAVGGVTSIGRTAMVPRFEDDEDTTTPFANANLAIEPASDLVQTLYPVGDSRNDPVNVALRGGDIADLGAKLNLFQPVIVTIGDSQETPGMGSGSWLWAQRFNLAALGTGNTTVLGLAGFGAQNHNQGGNASRGIGAATRNLGGSVDVLSDVDIAGLSNELPQRVAGSGDILSLLRCNNGTNAFRFACISGTTFQRSLVDGPFVDADQVGQLIPEGVPLRARVAVRHLSSSDGSGGDGTVRIQIASAPSWDPAAPSDGFTEAEPTYTGVLDSEMAIRGATYGVVEIDIAAPTHGDFRLIVDSNDAGGNVDVFTVELFAPGVKGVRFVQSWAHGGEKMGFFEGNGIAEVRSIFGGDIVLINLGANDASSTGTRLNKFAEDLKGLIDQIRSDLPGAHVCVMTEHATNEGLDGFGWDLESFLTMNLLARESLQVVEEYQSGVSFLNSRRRVETPEIRWYPFRDAAEAASPPASIASSQIATYTPDGVHADNLAGSRAFATVQIDDLSEIRDEFAEAAFVGPGLSRRRRFAT